MKTLAVVKMVWLFLILFGLLPLPAEAFGTIYVIPESGVVPEMLRDVHQAESSFEQILTNDIHLTLTRDVKVFVCPTRNSYENVLQREFGMSPVLARQEGEYSGGMADIRLHKIALNGGANSMGSSPSRVFAVGHELFHQVQGQLSSDNPHGVTWLKEGTADLMGAQVAEKLGYHGMEKWQYNCLHCLFAYPDSARPEEISYANLNQWTLLLKNKKNPYQMSDAMVVYLCSLRKASIHRDIVQYYRLLDRYNDSDMAFERAFGVSNKEFVAGFNVWLADQMSQIAAQQRARRYGVIGFGIVLTLAIQFSWKRRLASATRSL